MKDEMGLIFRKEHIRLILEGAKMQTRRRYKRPLKQGKVYDIKRDWFRRTGHLITNVFRQRLGDITPEEAVKEGGYTIKEFQAIGVGYTAHGTLLRESWCTSSVSMMDLNGRVWMVSADGASCRR